MPDIAYSVTVTGTDALKRLLQDSPVRTKRALQNAVVSTTKQLNLVTKTLIAEKLHRTGALERSIKTRIYPLRGTVGSGLVYARIQEYGGTIYPTAMKFLTIPLTEEYARIRFGTTSLRSLDMFYFVKSKNGNFFLFDKSTKAPAFLLVTSVRIPAKPYMRPAAQGMRDQFVKNIRTELKEAGLA